MDSIREDESRERRREEALARRVGEALDRLDPHGAEPCPDAEIIAAFQEHALSAEETETCEKHFAACSRCRKILGVLAASVDAPLAETEVARLGELVAAAKPAREGSVQPAKTARPNRFDWRIRWLAPALGVAAVLAMWFAVRPPWRNPVQETPGTLIAQAPKSEAAPTVGNQSLDRFANAAPAKQLREDSAPSSKDLEENRVGPKAEALKPPEEALAKNRSEGGGVGGIAPRAGVADDLSRDKKSESAQTPTPAVGVPIPLPPTPQPLTAQVPSSALQADVQATPGPAAPEPSETVNAANAPARSLAAPAARAAPSNKSASADSRVATFAASSIVSVPKVLTSPSGKVSWRIVPGGRVERSTDIGRTWVLQATPLQQEWLAGAAVSDNVCWIVGRDGAIARTIDGMRWELIASPKIAADSSGKYANWIGITAVDAQRATITAGDQRRYFTQDGGKSWQAQ